MSIESGETIGATDIGQLVNPGQSFEGQGFNGVPIRLTHFQDTQLGPIEPRNPIHNKLIVQTGEAAHHYTWEQVSALGMGNLLVGIGRLYQVYTQTEDPDQAKATCDLSISQEIALVSE